MPITITISAEDSGTALSLLRGLLGTLPTSGEATIEPTPEKPKATRLTKAKSEPTPVSNVEEPKELDPVETATTSATAAGDEPVTAEAVKARAMKYASQAGPIALVEMQSLALGVPADGKFPAVAADPIALGKLSALLADAGF